MAKQTVKPFRRLVLVRTCPGTHKEKDGIHAAEILTKDFAAQLDPQTTMPIPIIPIAWALDQPAWLVGFVLIDLRLTSLMALKEWEKAHPITTVLELGEGEDAIDVALASVGLRVHPLAD